MLDDMSILTNDFSAFVINSFTRNLDDVAKGSQILKAFA